MKRGECFGILGPNGAGKTTVVSMIYCFLPVTGGEVKVLGNDVKTEPRSIKKRLGVVPQENNLDLELTVLENLLVYAVCSSVLSRSIFSIMPNRNLSMVLS